VVAGDDERPEGQRIEKGACFDELAAERALGEIARDRHQIGRGRADRLNERREQPPVEAAEVQVGKMNDGAHQPFFAPAVSSGGTRTLSAPGMIR
jgi:hypothetical protein